MIARNDDSPLWFLIIGTLFVGAVLLFFATGAWGHEEGPGAWINQGQWRNPITNELCCNANDCKPIKGVVATTLPTGSWGYRLPSGERIEKNQTLQSQDAQFWRCASPIASESHRTRCLFVPRPPTM